MRAANRGVGPAGVPHRVAAFLGVGSAVTFAAGWVAVVDRRARGVALDWPAGLEPEPMPAELG